MFAVRYFCNRAFAPRYFPKLGAVQPIVAHEILDLSGVISRTLNLSGTITRTLNLSGTTNRVG